jgi:thiamine-monophosphate kinase
MTHPVPPGWHQPPSATIGEVGEHALIRWIAEIAGSSPSPDVLLGIGDDAAVIRPRRNHVDVLTTDVLVDGVHFTRAYSSASDIGHRALHVNLSDIASMGAEPRVAMLSLGLPSSLEAVWVAQLVHGLVEAARQARVHLVGGNISQSPAMFVDVTVSGAVKPRHLLRRRGARAGDELYVSGEVGAAAAGLALLRGRDGGGPSAPNPTPEPSTDEQIILGERALASWPAMADPALAAAVTRYRRPEARVALGLQVGRNKAASACMDTSDGLADALRQLARASGVGVRVEAAALPLSPAVGHAASTTGADAQVLTWAGGEDYELLFAVPRRSKRRFAHASGRKGLPPVTRIGVCTKDADLVVVQADGRDTVLPGGYEHFGRPTAPEEGRG